MSSPADSFKINLNQNLWGLIVTFAALGLAEQYHLCVLFWMAAVASSVMTLSVVITTAVYTFKYCKGKLV
jgi:hypothetical protein